jgi:hypothetical protein
MGRDGHGTQFASLQLQKNGHGAYQTISKVKVGKSGGYFDVKMKFSSGGNLRLAYTYPQDNFLTPFGVGGTTITGRSFKIKVH